MVLIHADPQRSTARRKDSAVKVRGFFGGRVGDK
jgi:hypothetical protein